MKYMALAEEFLRSTDYSIQNGPGLRASLDLDKQFSLQ